MNKKFQIMMKLSVLLGGSLVVMILLIGLSLLQLRTNMLIERKATIRKLVESAESVAYFHYMQAISGEISQEQAKERVKDAIRAIRYGEGGYIFVLDTKGVMQAHPLIPAYEGKKDLSILDAKGQNILDKIVQLALSGGGYYSYDFKRVDSGDKILPKIVYSRIFGPWDWVFATGVYVNDIDEAFHGQIKTWAQIVVIPFIILFFITYYLGVLIARPMFQLEKAKLNAESATRAKSDFLANMSHEIRTPLNGTMGMLALLLGTKMSAQQREWAQIAYQSSEELLNLINDILDISKVEAGHMTLEKLPFDLQVNIKAVTDLLYPRAHRKGVELLVSLQPDLPRLVVGDPVRLRQILLNLVGNAIKFTSKGSIEIFVMSESQDDTLQMRFEIKDTGIGIPEDKLGYIFEKFSQAEESTTRNFGGTGLGLAICRKLSNLMGGDVGVRSAIGQGSTFWFTVQLGKAEESTMIIVPPALSEPHRVLLCADVGKVSEILRMYLRKSGYRCDVTQGLDGVAVLLRQAMTLDDPYQFAIVEIDGLGDSPEDISRVIGDLFKASTLTRLIMIASPDKPLCGDDLTLPRDVGVLTKPVFPQDLYEVMRLLLRENNSGGSSLVLARQDQLGWHGLSGKNAQQGIADCAQAQAEKMILIVEDQTINQMLMKTVIKQLGYQSEMAGNGTEAVRMVAERRYGLVFMDCHMPEMDGFEATKQIRAFEESLHHHTPIIALTADAMVGDREKCLAAGMDDYLHKPVKTADIRSMIDTYLGA